jgi:uncharacterized repeat protein (TIGR01451 family)
MRKHLVSGALAVLFSLPLFGATLAYDARPGDGSLRLLGSGDRIVVTSGERIVASAPAASTEGVVIRGMADRDDTLAIDLSQPLHLPGGIDYDGGARGFDVLELRGGSIREQRATQLTPHDGIIELDGLVVRYSNLEPITDTAPAATYMIVGTAGLDTVTITDGPGGTTTVSSPTFESITFANKTSVTFDGLGGGDTVVVNNPTPATGLTSLIITNVATVSQLGSIRYPSFGVSATGNATLPNSGNDVDRVELSVSGAISFSDIDEFTVGGVSPALAGVSAAGSVVLTAQFGGMVIEENVVSQTGDVTLRLSRLVIDPAATISAPLGRVVIEPFNDKPNIDLGSATDASLSALELSDAELDRILTPVLSLETFIGVITVTQPITFAGELVLRTPNWFTATGPGSLTAPTLTFQYTFNFPKTWTITPTTIQITGGAPVPYTATTLNARSHDGSSPFATTGGNDTFVVTPSATTTINVDGNLPTPPESPGDTLDFELAGVINPVLTATLGPNGYSGSLTSANRQPVNFQDIETIVDAPVDIAVEKTDNATTAVAGTTVDYRVTVINNSPSIVTGVTVTDNFPPQLTNVTWICNGAGATCAGSGTGNINDTVTLLPNGQANYLITGMLPASTPPGTLTNTATVTTPAGFTETNPANNTATDTTTIVAEAGLLVTKNAASPNALPGSDITYTITVRNTGPSDAQNVVLNDVLPAGTSFVSLAAPPAYSCTTGATVTCSIATLAPSATADTFTLVVRVSPTATPGTVLNNTATLTSPTDTTPNTTTATVTVGAVPAGIPTLSQWMLMMFTALLAFVALRAAR